MGLFADITSVLPQCKRRFVVNSGLKYPLNRGLKSPLFIGDYFRSTGSVTNLETGKNLDRWCGAALSSGFYCPVVFASSCPGSHAREENHAFCQAYSVYPYEVSQAHVF